MATKRSGTKRYSGKASEKISDVMHEFKRGKLRSGSGQKVTDRKQAIAIGISEAREVGAKVPKEPAAKKRAPTKKPAAKRPAAKKRATTKKPAAKRPAAKKRATTKKPAAKRPAAKKRASKRSTKR